MLELSPAQLLAERLAHGIGAARAHEVLDTILDKFSPVDLAALAYDWRHTWARPRQIAPSGDWRWWGWLAGRGFGKTTAVVNHLQEEVQAGRATKILLVAQDEDNTIALQVLGPNGVVETSPPWCRATWIASQRMVIWPNGAQAYVRTPENPGKIRGLEYDLAWATELQSWPKTLREEAWMNVEISTRIGYARILWDATPKKGHPILKRLVADAETDPARYRLMRGKTSENRANLGNGYVEELERRLGGTTRGREELDGELLDESENALFKQAVIDAMRRPMPEAFAYRGLGIDPAITSKKHSDRTAIIEAARGVDGHGYVIDDLSGKHKPDEWADITLDRYVEHEIDVVVVETNKGGELVTQNLRIAAKLRKPPLTVVLVGQKERPRHTRGVVNVIEMHSKGSKSDRAQPLVTAYEKRRVSHVEGADLASLETTLTTWEPDDGKDSPDDLDALASVAKVVLELSDELPDHSKGFVGIGELAAMLARGGGGRRI